MSLARRAQFATRQVEQRLTLEPHGAGGRAIERQHGARQRRFARAGFADDAERPPRLHREADAVDRAPARAGGEQPGARDAIDLDEVDDLEQRRAHVSRPLEVDAETPRRGDRRRSRPSAAARRGRHRSSAGSARRTRNPGGRRSRAGGPPAIVLQSRAARRAGARARLDQRARVRMRRVAQHRLRRAAFHHFSRHTSRARGRNGAEIDREIVAHQQHRHVEIAL